MVLSLTEVRRFLLSRPDIPAGTLEDSGMGSLF